MFNPLLAAVLGFLLGLAFLALAQYLFRRLGVRRDTTVESVQPTFEPIRPTVEPVPPTVEFVPAVEPIPAVVESTRPVEIVDEELVAVLAAAAGETLQVPLRVLSYRVEPKR